jgi:hypothetical protein
MQETVPEVETIEESSITSEEITSSVSISESSDELSVEADGLHAELAENASEARVESFKCPTCSLVHAHSTNKHRSTDSFDMSVEDTVDMDFNPNCHCGVNELAHHGSDFGIDESEAESVASSAPIPDETSQKMSEMY